MFVQHVLFQRSLALMTWTSCPKNLARQVGAASFTHGCVHLPIQSRPISCVCNRTSDNVTVSASAALRCIHGTAQQSDERDCHTNEGLDPCDVDFVWVRTVLGTDQDIVHAIVQVRCEILPVVGG